MATVNVLTTSNFSMMDADIGDLYEAAAYFRSSTGFKAIWLNGNEYDWFTGTGFTYNVDGEPVSGTVTGYRYYLYEPKVEVTNASVAATTIASFAKADNTVGAFQYVLSGNDSMTGNIGADVLYGYGGNDVMNGGNGNDSLYGGDGNDSIDGGAGNDSMIGGLGNDVYTVNATTDIVSELSGQGSDLIKSSVTYSLVDTDGLGSNGGNVEKLTLTGSAIKGTGNSLSNILTGNSANNQLVGNGGADKLYGNSGGDKLYGNKGDDDLFGGNGNDTLDGGDGYDYLFGGAGNDVLIGGLSIDDFHFNTALNASTNVDTIKSFAMGGIDLIYLYDDIFTALGPVTQDTPLAAEKFHKAAGATTAHDADDRIIYNTSTGALYYDADGTGSAHAAIKFANLGAGTDSHPDVTAADFMIYA